jgi:hypothetical protein
MDNLEGLALGGWATTYYADPDLLRAVPMLNAPPGNLDYHRPSPLEKEIRRIIDRTTGELQKHAKAARYTIRARALLCPSSPIPLSLWWVKP